MENKEVMKDNVLHSFTEEVLTRKELASFLKVGYSTILALEKKRMIPCVKIGKRTFFLKSEVIKWLREHQLEAIPEQKSTEAKRSTEARELENSTPSTFTNRLLSVQERRKKA